MRATMAYMENEDKRTLNGMSLIGKEPLELDVDEPSSSRFEPELSLQGVTRSRIL